MRSVHIFTVVFYFPFWSHFFIGIDSVCQIGTYGDDCELRCPNCYGPGTCNRETGICDQGCKPRYRGERCDQYCSNFRYGPNCYSHCSDQCAGMGDCFAESGKCLYGCTSGFEPPNCEKKCPLYFYGTNCDMECSPYCLHSRCTVTLGTCESGCIAGFQGRWCNRPCVKGSYGQGCKQRCSENCEGNGHCDPVTGFCLDGCKPGYNGFKCQTTVSRRGPLDIFMQYESLIAVIVVFSFLICLLNIKLLIKYEAVRDFRPKVANAGTRPDQSFCSHRTQTTSTEYGIAWDGTSVVTDVSYSGTEYGTEC